MTQPPEVEEVNPRIAARRQPVARVAARALKRQIEWLRVGAQTLQLPIDSRTVHDMRVAARRTRVALRAFRRLVGRERAGALTRELRWIADRLAETRDWDIVMGRVKKSSEDTAVRLAADDATMRTALSALAQARAEAHARLADGLASARYAELVQSLVDTARDLEQQTSDDAGGDRLRAFAAKRIARASKRVRSRVGDDVHVLGMKRLHGVRIRVRRLRYLVEFFGDLGGTTFADAATQLAAAQDALGAAQDAIVAERLLDLLARRAAGGQDGESGLESLLVRFRQGERRSARRARSELVRTWRRLPKTLRMLERALRA